MRNGLFYGCATALITPFRGEGVDYDALDGLIEWQIASGVDALVVLGTTGEPSTLSPSERADIIRRAAERIDGRTPMIVGAGSNDTRTAVRLAEQARRLGADAVLSVTPYYNKASREGLMAHFRAIADSVDVPVIMYNVPSRTGVSLSPDTVAELAKHPNLCAVKEASGDLRQMTDLAAACGDGVAVYCGNDDQVLPAMALGARGVISVAANVIPARMREMTAAFLKGDVERCRALQLEWLPLIRLLFCEVNPIPVKAALSMLGRAENTLRLPLTPLNAEQTAALKREMEQMGLPEM